MFKLSMISSLQYFTTCVGCVLAGPLSDLLGVRTITATGVALGIVGSTISVFAGDRSIAFWVLSFGVLVGCGNSLLEVNTLSDKPLRITNKIQYK